MPPSRDSQGNPLRYVPRRPQAPFPAGPHSSEAAPKHQLAGAGEPIQLPILPPPANVPFAGVVDLVNAIRQLLIDQGLAREEE